MLYKKFDPAIGLKPLIHTYFLWEDSTNEKTVVIESPPSAYGGIVFNLGGTYRAGMYGKKLNPTSRIFFAGQATKSYTLELKDSICMFGLVLRATSLYHLLGVPQRQFQNRREDLTVYLGNDVKKLYHELLRFLSIDDRVESVNNYFLKLVKEKKIERDSFDESVDYIDEVYGNTTLNEVVARFAFSPRYYQKLFMRRVGVSPKTYMRMRRMSHICYLLNTQQEINWQDIVYEGGYFDQSHFIKDFVDFIGRNPSLYFKENKELARLLK